MRQTKFFIGMLIIMMVSSGTIFHVVAQTPVPQEESANINFEWAFGALVGKDKNFVQITHDTTLQSGDEIKMMVKLHKDCYVYVVYYGTQGEVELLFPYSLKQFQTDYEVDKNYYIPVGREWLKLDNNTGKERIFVIASYERLLDLEAAISEYYLASEPSKKQSLAEKIVNQIREMRKKYASYATIAEKPITIGGNIRSTNSIEERRRIDIADIAIGISAKNFYSKTFTIDHQ
ncbi:MAG TPA: DUF4384 domain-containing protein [Bacteroidota bacterium]|nr:DUF4384 domain-containing protein [Bacteroidota bacterium]